MRPNERKQLVSSTIFNRTVLGSARAAGASPERLLGHLGIDRGLLENPEAWLPAVAVEDFLELLGRELDHPAPGIWVGEHVIPEAADVLGYAMRTAPTLGDAYQTAARYYGLVGTGVEVYFSEIEGQGRFIHAVAPELASERRHRDEMVVSTLLALGRAITGAGWSPVFVHFQHPKPDDTNHHLRFLGEQVRFDEPACELAIRGADLEQPSVGADEVLHEILERLAKSTDSNDAPSGPLIQQVRQALLNGLPSGDLSLEVVARAMGMGPRTLQRRLAEENTSHKGLLRQTRHYMAEQYLRSPQFSIDEIAFLLGYANTPSFTRAFRTWTGKAPSEYRTKENGAAG